MRRGGGGLFHLEETIVSVLHKELEYKVEKLKCNRVGGHVVKDQNQGRGSIGNVLYYSWEYAYYGASLLFVSRY